MFSNCTGWQWNKLCFIPRTSCAAYTSVNICIWVTIRIASLNETRKTMFSRNVHRVISIAISFLKIKTLKGCCWKARHTHFLAMRSCDATICITIRCWHLILDNINKLVLCLLKKIDLAWIDSFDHWSHRVDPKLQKWANFQI